MTPSDPQPPSPGQREPSGGSGAGRSGSGSGSSGEAEFRIFDAALEQLDPREQEAWMRRLASDPSLAKRQAEWGRWIKVFRAATPEPPEHGLAQRLALRVRDQVAHEEHVHRREVARQDSSRADVSRARSGWTRRTSVRLVLASLGVHVALLGWIVWRQAPTPAREDHAPVLTQWQGQVERDPALLASAEPPLDLGPVVTPEEIPDTLLVDHGLQPDDSALPPAAEPVVRVAEHPFAVQFSMLARGRAPVKSARLRRAGLDPDGTRLSVERGLRALASRQDTDGSFPADATSGGSTLGALGRTGLALLPFLAEGRSSAPRAGEPTDGVVAPGIAWLRRKLSPPTANPHGGLAPSDLALGVLALSEDYMLAYGRWSPAEARSRAEELRGLSERLAALQRPDGSFEDAGATASVWPVLALDGVRHAGVALPTGGTLERVERWMKAQRNAAAPSGDTLVDAGRLLFACSVAGAAGQGRPTREAGAAGQGRPTREAGAAGLAQPTQVAGDSSTLASTLVAADLSGGSGPLTALVASVALYRCAPAAFRDWNRAQGEPLRARLAPSGLVADGDAVTDTALVLLALQSAYRAY